MPTFTISKATSLSFEIKTGTGTVNDGLTIEDNYLWTGISDHFNACLEDITNDEACHKFTTTDTTSLQIYYDNGSNLPRLAIHERDTDYVVDLLIHSSVNSNYYNFTIDWSTIGAGCYVAKIWTDDPTSSNLFTYGDNGTHELGVNNLATGGSNVLSQSGAQAESGSFSALITAPGSTTTDERLIYANDSGNPVTLAAGVYYATFSVYNDSVNPFITGGAFYVTATHDGSFGGGSLEGWTDGIDLIQTTGDGSIQGSWQKVDCYFSVQSDTTGNIVLYTDQTPQANGLVYVDNVKITLVSEILEAESDKICIETSWPYTSLVTWTNTETGFGIDYTSVAITHSMRIGLSWWRWRMDDEDLEVTTDGDNSTSVQVASPFKVHICQTDAIAPALLEKLALALAHDSFYISGTQFSPVDSSFQPDWDTDGNQPLARAEFEARRTNYNYQNTGC